MDEKLNDKQRKIVEENLDMIDMVIWKCIRTNSHVCGMEYDDIYQVGAIGLCKAAANYRRMEKVKFSTYAFCVIRNTILDYLRSLNTRQEAFRQFLSDADDYIEQQMKEEMDSDLYEKDVLQALNETKDRCSSTARKGIEAIEMKMQGYSGKDIAEKYSVKANYITACISRAQKYLKQDDIFMKKLA